MPAELTYFPVSGFLGTTTVNGSELPFNATAVCTPRLPAGFTALISNLDTGSGTGADTALAFPPQPFTSVNGVITGALLANDATVLGPALAAAGITQLWYDVNFTQVSLGYQVPQSYSFPAPTTATPVSLTGPSLTRYAYGGTVPVVSLPAGVTAFGVSLIGAANEAAAQALLGIPSGALSAFLGTVSSQAAMLALSAAATGDFCYRSDLNSFYYLTATPPGTLANWVAPEALPAIADNTDGTMSVAGVNVLEPLSTVTILTASTAPAVGQTTYYNATSGNLTPPLPALSGLRVGARLAVRRDPADVSQNTVTLTCAGSDTFYSSGGTTATLPMSGEQREYQVISVSGTKYWTPQGSLNPVAALDQRYFGSFATKTSNYTLTLADRYIEADATTSSITLTLPTAVGNASKVLTFKRIDSATSLNTVTVAAASGQTIDGLTSQLLVFSGHWISVLSDGVNWLAIGNNYAGTELGYAETFLNSPTTNTATDDASLYANTIPGLSITVIGAGKPVVVEFSGLAYNATTAATLVGAALLVNGSAVNGTRALVSSPAITPPNTCTRSISFKRRMMLTTGTVYTFTVGMWTASGTAQFWADSAGPDPMYLAVEGQQ